MSQNQSTQTLGEFLKREREKSGLTLEQVASATKISIHTLRLIESDQYRDLPAKPFVRGFIISYSRFIGLDPKEILTRYSSFIEEKAQERPTRDSGHSGYAFERRETDNSRKILLATLSAFLIIGLVIVLVAKPKSRKKHHGGEEPVQLAPTPIGATGATAALPTGASPSISPVPTILPNLIPSAAPASPTKAPAPVTPSPTPTPKKATPTPTSIPTPKAPTPTSSPTPTPKKAAVTPAPSPGPSSPAATITPTPKPDPLDSGSGLSVAQIKFKAVFKAKKDLWIRYQSDERPVRRIILRNGNVLVLRAEKLIKAEVSDETAAQITSNGKTILDPTPSTDQTGLTSRSFTFSNRPESGVTNLFSNEEALPRSSPPPRAAPAQNTP